MRAVNLLAPASQIGAPKRRAQRPGHAKQRRHQMRSCQQRRLQKERRAHLLDLIDRVHADLPLPASQDAIAQPASGADVIRHELEEEADRARSIRIADRTGGPALHLEEIDDLPGSQQLSNSRRLLTKSACLQCR